MNAPLLELFTEDTDSPRAFRRFSLNFPIGVIPVSDKSARRGSAAPAKTSATMTNASMNGFCFSSLTEFAEDTQIEIELDLGSQTHRVPALVRRCSTAKRLGRTFYECGAQYLKSESTLRFLPLMAKYLLTRSPEKSMSDQ